MNNVGTYVNCIHNVKRIKIPTLFNDKHNQR